MSILLLLPYLVGLLPAGIAYLSMGTLNVMDPDILESGPKRCLCCSSSKIYDALKDSMLQVKGMWKVQGIVYLTMKKPVSGTFRDSKGEL